MDPTAQLRTVTFGALDGTAWAASCAGVLQWMAAAAGPARGFASEASIDDAGPQGVWTLSGPLGEFTLSGLTPPAPLGTAEGSSAGEPESDDFEQLCRVQGRLHLEGEVHELDALGRRARRTLSAIERIGSFRDVFACFEEQDGLAVVALRPARESGHAADAVSAANFEPAGPVAVAEARLSTTYTFDGTPTRMGLELWLGDEEGEQHLRRMAGELAGDPVAGEAGGFRFRVAPLSCHSRGADGFGVYVLGRRR